MKRIFILFPLFIFFISSAFAQAEGSYLITQKKDTLYGELVSMGQRSVKFKIDGKKKTFGARDVFRVFDATDQSLYAPSHIEEGKIKISGSTPKKYRIFDRARAEGLLTFGQILADGDIIVYTFSGGAGRPMMMNSYSGTMTGGGASPAYYFALKKSKNEVIQLWRTGGFLAGSLPKNRIVENIGDFMDDAPDLLNQLENEKKLDNALFIEYIKRYNAYKKETAKDAVDYGTQLF